MAKPSIYIGQIWRLVDADKYYNVGAVGDLAVILALANGSSVRSPVWSVGCFWWSGEKPDDWGGARQKDMDQFEIHQVFEYVGHIREHPAIRGKA